MSVDPDRRRLRELDGLLARDRAPVQELEVKKRAILAEQDELQAVWQTLRNREQALRVRIARGQERCLDGAAVFAAAPVRDSLSPVPGSRFRARRYKFPPFVKPVLQAYRSTVESALVPLLHLPDQPKM